MNLEMHFAEYGRKPSVRLFFFGAGIAHGAEEYSCCIEIS